MEVAKALLVDVEGIKQSGTVRTATAATHNEGRRKGLESSDHLQDQVKEYNRCQEREGDPEKFADGSRAINTCCLIHLMWDLLETGQEDEYR